jgi:ABC-type multidrug transport system ATPase subunit
VIEDLALTLTPGRAILLGPNGAGKSTVLGLAASAFVPRRGSVTLGGLATNERRDRKEYRAAVAWMPQVVRAASGVTTREQVALHGWLKGLSRTEAWWRSQEALRRVDLSDRADEKASRLSGGQRARMGLAQALVHDASALLLDEPTASLDPDQRERFATLLRDTAGDRTVLVSTHDVSDIADYDRVLVMTDGRLRFDGSLATFLEVAGPERTALSSYRAITGVHGA